MASLYKISFYVYEMSLEDFQLRDNEAIDSSVIERDFLKIYHRKAANSNDSDQKIEFIFVDNNNYHQIGNVYLQFELKIEKMLLLQLIEFL